LDLPQPLHAPTLQRSARPRTLLGGLLGSRIACRALLLALSVALASPAARPSWLHEGDENRVAELSRQLSESGPSGQLLLRRADSLRRLERWGPALADLADAATVIPEGDALHSELLLARGRLALDLGWLAGARESLDQLIGQAPDHELGRAQRQALELLALVLRAQGERRPEADVLSRLARIHPEPQPALFLDLADTLASLASDQRTAAAAALGALDLGLERLGPIVTLELAAVDRELEREAWDDALARLERIKQSSARQERWWSQQGDVLLRAGRPAEARDAWLAARAAIDTINPLRRNTQMVKDLESHLTEQLATTAHLVAVSTDTPRESSPPCTGP